MANESIPQSHYNPDEEMDIFMNWANELCKQDKEFADTLVSGLVAAEFPEPVPKAETL
jgi:hypothetical protein